MDFNEIDKIIYEHQNVIKKIIQSEEIKLIIVQIINIVINGLKNNKKILLAGNGGSSSDSQHMCGELVGKLNFDREGLAAISLTTDTTVMTAISNDYSYDDIIARQIQALCNEEDIVILYSTSGNSKNILKAIFQSRKSKAIVIGFTGMSGGSMLKKCDLCLRIPSNSVQRIQECHHLINHIICEKIEEILFNKS